MPIHRCFGACQSSANHTPAGRWEAADGERPPSTGQRKLHRSRAHLLARRAKCPPALHQLQDVLALRRASDAGDVGQPRSSARASLREQAACLAGAGALEATQHAGSTSAAGMYIWGSCRWCLSRSTRRREALFVPPRGPFAHVRAAGRLPHTLPCHTPAQCRQGTRRHRCTAMARCRWERMPWDARLVSDIL